MVERARSGVRGEEVPEILQVWLEEHLASGDDSGDPQALVRAARSAIRAALSPGGRERGGAFDLLAADGHLTEAVRSIVETSAEPLLELERLVSALQDEVGAS